MSDPADEPVILYLEVPDFYAEVERLRGPGTAPLAILVGGDPRKRGKVQSASAEARTRGVSVGMSMQEALALCPDAVRRATDMPRYRAAQGELEVCLRRSVDAIESAGYGAAYLDGGASASTARALAEQLVVSVRSDVGLPLRVGIGPSKLIARLAAGEAAGPPVRQVRGAEVRAFLAPQPVSRLPRIGRKAEQRLAELGATTIGGLLALGPEALGRVLGPRVQAVADLARGRDPTPVRASGHPRSLSRGETLPDLAPGEAPDLAGCLGRLATALERELLRHGLRAGRLALRVRFADQTATTRSTTLGEPIDQAADLRVRALGLLDRASGPIAAIRGLGLTVAGLVAAGQPDPQLELFDDSTA